MHGYCVIVLYETVLFLQYFAGILLHAALLPFVGKIVQTLDECIFVCVCVFD